MGRRNQRTITLIELHCRNARVEKSPHWGEGLVEAMSGLPIGAREIGCPHAIRPSMAGMDLERTAVDFYRNNCDGCPHRDAVAVPNLKTRVEELDRTIAAERDRVAAARATRSTERGERSRRRAESVEDEPRPVREWISLLDGVDSEEIDARADEFLDVAVGGPELCTPNAAAAITETAEQAPNRQLLKAVDVLNAAGRIEDGPALGAALAALRRGPYSEAIPLIARLQEAIDPATLKPCLASIIHLAGPQDHFGFSGAGTVAEVVGLRVAAAVDLPSLLDSFGAMVGSPDPWERGPAASAAAMLIELEPGSAEILAAMLIEALSLPGSTDHHMGSPQRAISTALEAALMARPREVASLYLRRGPDLGKEEREMLYRAFDRLIRTRMNSEVPVAAGEVAVESLFQIAGGADGENAANSAAGSLELAAHYHPELMVGRAAALFGSLISALSAPVELDPGTPRQLGALAMGAQRALRSGRVSHLKGALAHLARHDPTEVAEEVFTVLDNPDPPGSTELRAELTKILGGLGVHPQLREEVLPRLYTALLSDQQSVRAAGIDAWREMARAPHFQAPAELEDLILVLIADPFVIVHQAMIRALRHQIPVPPRLYPLVVVSLVQIAEIYAQPGQDQDGLDDILDTLWFRIGSADAALRGAVRRKVLAFAERLRPHGLERLLARVEGAELELAEYADRLLEVIAADEEIVGGNDDHLMRRLRDLPSEAIRARLDLIGEAARGHLPRWTGQAAEFVEVLQVGGSWKEAAELAEEIAAAVPDDTEHALQRAAVLAMAAAAELELAVFEGNLGRAATVLLRWREASEAEQALRAARPSPFDLDVAEGLDA